MKQRPLKFKSTPWRRPINMRWWFEGCHWAHIGTYYRMRFKDSARGAMSSWLRHRRNNWRA